MKPKRRIKAICRRLQETPNNPEAKLALSVLTWVLNEEEDLKFQDILPDYQEPEPKISQEKFMYDLDLYVWAMEDPAQEGYFFISKNLPKYTPKGWWEKLLLNDINLLSYGDDFIHVQNLYEDDEISWVEIENVFREFQDYFRTREEAQKYLEYFFKIDYSDMKILSRADREEIKEKEGCGNRWFQKALKEKYKLEKIYVYKSQGEEIWAMRKM